MKRRRFIEKMGPYLKALRKIVGQVDFRDTLYIDRILKRFRYLAGPNENEFGRDDAYKLFTLVSNPNRKIEDWVGDNILYGFFFDDEVDGYGDRSVSIVFLFFGENGYDLEGSSVLTLRYVREDGGTMELLNVETFFADKRFESWLNSRTR